MNNTLAIIGVSAVVLIAVNLVYHQVVNGQNMRQEQRESLINYCYQYADRPNPIQDLIDKGFLPSSLKGQTCLSVKQMYDKIQTIIDEPERQKALRYKDCVANITTESGECYRILDNKTIFDNKTILDNKTK